MRSQLSYPDRVELIPNPLELDFDGVLRHYRRSQRVAKLRERGRKEWPRVLPLIYVGFALWLMADTGALPWSGAFWMVFGPVVAAGELLAWKQAQAL